MHGQLDLTIACLKSLKKTVFGYEYEIIIVDDASDEQTQRGLNKLEDDHLRIIRNDQNRGYAHSNNRGARHANGEILFLLNNDLELQPDWLKPMVEAFSQMPDAGLVGNIQLNFRTLEIDHAGYLVSWNARLRHKRVLNKSLVGTPRYSRFNAVTGACCAIRKSVFDAVQGFDEAYRNGCEDIDLCFRLLKSGYKNYVANNSLAKHHVSATRKAPGISEEKNFRYLQRKWENDIIRFAAYDWPNHYLKHFWKSPHRQKFPFFQEAIVRYLFLEKSPSPTGLQIASAKLHDNERHWKSLLDGLSDETIKTQLKTHPVFRLTDILTISGFTGFGNDFDGYWVRENASIRIPDTSFLNSLSLCGKIYPATSNAPETLGALGIRVRINELETRSYFPLQEGPFEITLDDLPRMPDQENRFEIDLIGVGLSNFYAYLGRVISNKKIVPNSLRERLERYRPKKINKRVLFQKIRINGEDVLDATKDSSSPHVFDFIKRYGKLGINLVGWYNAQLGIGESVRLAAKSIAATSLNASLVPLKVNCLSAQEKYRREDELTSKNPFPINIFHIDPAQCGDIDHHHGGDFRKDKYNIGYWAWELTEFPDDWLKYFKYFDEIWTPSDFSRNAISMKSPIPVVKVPHCIQIPKSNRDWRAVLKLPKDKFLFSFVYDLNSYQERKNPLATIKAFKSAFSGDKLENDVGLIIKTQSIERNRLSYQELANHLKGVKNIYLMDQPMSREEVYGLMRASDAYVSLHRAEGFGLTVAESMYLGKPVISSDWSATAEFVKGHNGCPIRCKLFELEKSYGPYSRGQIWADPDVGHAAEMMKRLVTDSQYRKHIGYNAAKSIRAQFSPHYIGQLYEKRIKAITLW